MNMPRNIALIASLCLILGACEQDLAPAAGENATEKTLRVAFDGAPRSLDPGSASSVYAVGIVLAAYETLFEYRYGVGPLTLDLGLASGWPEISENGKELTINIRSNSMFSDNKLFANGLGRTVVAGDVAFTILRHFDSRTNSQAQYLWRDLIEGIHDWTGDYDELPTGIEVVDDQTIVFRLTRASPQFLHTLSTAFSAVLPAELANSSVTELKSATIGSGPFRLISIDSAKAVLGRNLNFRQQGRDATENAINTLGRSDFSNPDMVDYVQIEFIDDPTARWVSFQNRDVHIAIIADDFLDPMLRSHQPIQLKDTFAESYSIHPYFASEAIFYRIRMDDPSIGVNIDPKKNERNRKLRCAIHYSIDWSKRNQFFYGGDAHLYSGVIPPSLPEYDSSRSFQAEGRVSEASKIIASVMKNHELPVVTYGHTTSVQAIQNFEFFRSSLMAAGYPQDKIQGVQYASFGDFMIGSSDGSHQITLTSWGLDFGDAENILQLFYGPNRSPGANLSNFQDDEFDSLYDQMKIMTPSKSRTAIVNQMNDILEAKCVFSGSATRERVIITHKDIVGFPNHDATQIGRYFQYISMQ